MWGVSASGCWARLGFPRQAPLKLFWKPSWRVGAREPRRSGQCVPCSLRWSRANATVMPVQGPLPASVALTKEARGTHRGPVINDHGLQAPRYAQSHQDVEHVAPYGIRDRHVAKAWRGQSACVTHQKQVTGNPVLSCNCSISAIP